jgi:pleckstrin homology domain-containing family H
MPQFRPIFYPQFTDLFFQIGHLAKLGGKLKTWRKRWFVLKDGILTYWKSQHDINRKPQGQILLDEACRITRAEGASTFEINTGKKIYYLTADSNATMDDWIRVLQVRCRSRFCFRYEALQFSLHRMYKDAMQQNYY